MRDLRSGHELRALVAATGVAQSVEEALPPPEQDRRDRDVQVVDEAGAERALDGCDAPRTSTSRPAAAAKAFSSAT
jgi:hypothetical protein